MNSQHKSFPPHLVPTTWKFFVLFYYLPVVAGGSLIPIPHATRHTPHATRHTPHTTHHTPHTTHHTQPMLPTSGFPRLFRRNIRVHTTHHTPHTTRNPCYLLAAFHASFVETSGYSFSFPQLVSCIPLYPLPHIIPCLYQDVCTSVMCRLAAFHAFHRNIRVRFHFSATRNMFQIDENELWLLHFSITSALSHILSRANSHHRTWQLRSVPSRGSELELI